MPGKLRRFDPTALEIASKFVDSDYAPKTVVVSATSATLQPLPGQIWYDKAAARQERGELRRFSPREVHFADVLARAIDNPLLVNEMILFDKRKLYLDTSIELEYSYEHYRALVTERFQTAISSSIGSPIDERFREETVLIAEHEGGGTWGHYLTQSIPRMMLFLEAFPSGKIAVGSWLAEHTSSFGQCLTAYNIPRERLAPLEPGTVYRFRQAILLDFLFNFEARVLHPKALPMLRTPLHENSRTGKRAAFIKRRNDVARQIANDQAVDEVMDRHGINTYGKEDLALSTQIDIWQSHDLLIATLGSDLTNMIYARPGTRLLVLSPHWFGDNFFFELSIATGVRWCELRCGEIGVRHPEHDRSSTFNIDLELLDAILTSLGH